MENHHAINGKTHYKWLFSIAIFVCLPGRVAEQHRTFSAGRCGGGRTAGPISGQRPQPSIGITLTYGELLQHT